MVAQVWHPKALNENAAQDIPLCADEGERLGLYSVIGHAGSVTAFGLATQAMIPVSLAYRWLAAQVQGGYAVRDVATGRYRTWCVLPDQEEEVET